MANYNKEQLIKAAGQLIMTTVTVGITVVAALAKVTSNNAKKINRNDKFNRLSSEIDSINQQIHDKRSEPFGPVLNHSDIVELSKKLSEKMSEKQDLFNRK